MAKLIIKATIEADFNAQDVDGAVRLYFPLRLATSGNEIELELQESEKIWLTDGDVEVVGTLMKRGEFWVVLPSEKYQQVNENAPHHIKNQKRYK